MSEPITPSELPGYDTLPWPDDVLAAWMEADEQTRQGVRVAAPDVAAALDRQAEVVTTPRGERRTRVLRAPGQPRRPVPWEE